MNVEKDIFLNFSYDERYLDTFANLKNSDTSDNIAAYIVLMPDTAVEYNNDHPRTQTFKRLVSCIFSFGVNQNTIRNLSLKDTSHYIHGTIILFIIMSIIVLIGVFCVTHNALMAIIAWILVVSFCYGPIQMMTIPLERIKFYIGYNTTHPTELWQIDKINECSFDEFYAIFINHIRPLKFYPLKNVVSLRRKISILNKIAHCNKHIHHKDIPAILFNLKELLHGCEVFMCTRESEILKYSQNNGR